MVRETKTAAIVRKHKIRFTLRSDGINPYLTLTLDAIRRTRSGREAWKEVNIALWPDKATPRATAQRVLRCVRVLASAMEKLPGQSIAIPTCAPPPPGTRVLSDGRIPFKGGRVALDA